MDTYKVPRKPWCWGHTIYDERYNPKLDAIDLSNIGLLDDELVSYLIHDLNSKNKKHIKFVNLYRNNLSNRTIRCLSKIKYVENINLCYNNIDNQGILDLIENIKVIENFSSNLKIIDLSENNNITQETINLLLPYLPHCTIKI